MNRRRVTPASRVPGRSPGYAPAGELAGLQTKRGLTGRVSRAMLPLMDIRLSWIKTAGPEAAPKWLDIPWALRCC